MSSRNHPKTLLPPNAQTAESALATAAARLSDLPVPVATLWDPARCPASYLPWLAWALSVDSWDSTWPEAVKRQVLAQSIAVHQRKGTVGAVRRAMAALGVQIDLQEWWQTSPQGTPHTFSLTAYANANLGQNGAPVLSAQLYRALQKVVDATKPVRSHYDLTIAARFADAIVLKDALSGVNLSRVCVAPPTPNLPAVQAALSTMAGATSLGLTRTSAAAALPRQDLRGGLGLCAGASGLGLGRQSMACVPPLHQTQASRLFTKAAAQGLSVIRLSMELRA